MMTARENTMAKLEGLVDHAPVGKDAWHGWNIGDRVFDESDGRIGTVIGYSETGNLTGVEHDDGYCRFVIPDMLTMLDEARSWLFLLNRDDGGLESRVYRVIEGGSLTEDEARDNMAQYLDHEFDSDELVERVGDGWQYRDWEYSINIEDARLLTDREIVRYLTAHVE
jgi:hypothetical protein